MFVEDIFIARRTNPEKPLMLLLHGAGGQHLQWMGVARMLDEAAIIAPDLPGHGRSSGTGEETIGSYAAHILRLMDHLDIDRALIGGHSMGGAIALALALHHSDRVAGLVLASTGARLKVGQPVFDALEAGVQPFVDLFDSMAYGPQTDPDLIARGRDLLAEAGRDVIQRDFEACHAFDVREHIAQIMVPALVLCGSADRMTPPHYAESLAAAIPGARLHLIDGAGHMLPVEQPDETAAHINAWLHGLTG